MRDRPNPPSKSQARGHVSHPGSRGLYGVKVLTTATLLFFIVDLVLGWTGFLSVPDFLGLSHDGVLGEGRVWQLLTYVFFHDVSFVPTLVLALSLALLVTLGAEVERAFGWRRFLAFYLLTAVGVGFVHLLLTVDRPGAVTYGALGPTFGIVLAYWLLFPGRQALGVLKVKHLLLGVTVVKIEVSSDVPPEGGIVRQEPAPALSQNLALFGFQRAVA